MTDIVLSALLAAALLLDVRKAGAKRETFSVAMSDSAKGLAAVIILLHHISQRADGCFWNFAGFCAVGLFFFCAGYGVMYGTMKRDHYIKMLLLKKIPRLLLMMCAAVAFSTVYWMIEGTTVRMPELFAAFLGNRLLNWFFGFLIIKYVFFAICKAAFPHNEPALILLLSLMMMALCIVCYMAGWDFSRYFSAFCFPLGAAAGYLENSEKTPDPVINRAKIWVELAKGKACIPVVLLAIFFVLFLLTGALRSGNIISWAMAMPLVVISSALFAAGLYLASFYVCSRGFFAYVGKYSAEMILLQTIALSVFRSSFLYINSDLLYVVLSVVSGFSFQLIGRPVFKRIKAII